MLKHLARFSLSIIVLTVLFFAGSDARADVYLVDFDEHRAEFLMLEAINTIRYQHRLPLLGLDNSLSQVSRRHAIDMATRNYFDHFTPEGLSPDDRVQRAGLPYTLHENIGIIRTFGEGTKDVVDALMQGFMNSPDHRKNILNPYVTHVGIGFYQDMDGKNQTLNNSTDPQRIYRGFGTVLVVQDFYRRTVSVVEPVAFSGTAEPGEFLDVKLKFTDEIEDAFIRIIPVDGQFEVFDIPLSKSEETFDARFAIDREGKFTLAIYACAPPEEWYYAEKGSLELSVQRRTLL